MREPESSLADRGAKLGSQRGVIASCLWVRKFFLVAIQSEFALLEAEYEKDSS